MFQRILEENSSLEIVRLGELDSDPFGVEYQELDEYGEIKYRENLIYAEVLQVKSEVFHRFDFNPNSLKKRNAEFVWEYIRQWFDELEAEYRLSRFDLAIDILNSSEIHGLKCVRPGVTRKEFYGRDGVLETIYWGSRQSDVQVRLYNKIREMKSEEREKLDSEITSWWRLEMQMRSKKIDENLANEFANRLDEFSLSNPLVWDLKNELKRFAVVQANVKNIRDLYPDVPERTLRSWKAKVRKAEKEFDDDAYRKVLKNALQNQMQDIKSELDKYLEIYLGF